MIKNYKQCSFYPKYKRTKSFIRLFFDSFHLNPLKRTCFHFDHFRKVFGFLKDHRKLWSETHPQFEYNSSSIFPFLTDKTESTPVDAVYFYQNAWCVGKVVANKPKRHVDIGSQLPAIGILSQIIPVEFVDIRTIPVTLPGLKFVQGDITKLPYADSSIESLSSICVIEHIGLGRYGDAIDAYGTEKAIKELLRILAPNGRLYITVPIDKINRIYFNAHRAFTPNYIKSLFPNCELMEERYIYGYEVQDTYEPIKGFGTGMYYFRKN